MVRRPGFSIYDRIGLQDMTTDDTYFERGINLRHGYLAEYYADDANYPGWLPKLLTHPVNGLENYEQLFHLLLNGDGAIKVFCEVAAG